MMHITRIQGEQYSFLSEYNTLTSVQIEFPFVIDRTIMKRGVQCGDRGLEQKAF
jgi:hypothetical protein